MTYAPPPASMTYDDDTTGAGDGSGETAGGSLKGETSGGERVNRYRLETYNGQTVPSDLDGNLRDTPLNGTLLGTLNWDARNRLTSAESEINNQQSTISYSYDAENRRVTSTSPAGTTRYTWSREAPLDRLLVKENPDGSVTRYIHGLGLIYEETEPAGGGPVTTQYYHYNWQGSTMALSNQAGTVTARLSYSPYGEVTVDSGTPNTPFLFNGQFGVMTEPNGLYCLQARFYSPIFRRFLSEDPAGFSGGINLFAYTGGDPVNLMDPFGLGPQTSFWQTGLGSVVEGFGSGLRQGLDNFNNTVTFGFYDHIGWSNSSANTGWEHDLSRSFASIPRDVAAGGVLAGVGSVISRTFSSVFGSVSNFAARTANNGTGVLGRSGEPLVNAAIQPIRNQATTIGGRQFTGHALDQMQNRGFMPSVIENTIRQGLPFPTRAGTTGFYDPVNNIRVITNSASGRVITVIQGAP